MAKTTDVTSTEKVDPNRKKPKIKDVRPNSQTEFWFRQLAAYAPAGFETSDLNDPECWDGSKLMTHDHIYIRAHDDAWAADGVIVWTNNKDAVFDLSKLHWFNRQRDPLASDENYTVVAQAGAFAVVRRRDGVVVSQGHATEGLAAQALRNQYSKKVA